MPSTEHRHKQSIVLGIVCDDQKVLVGERAAELHQGGYLEFPGGKLEDDEAQQDGLAREVYEETGIEVLRSQPLIQFEWEYPQYHLSFSVYKVDTWTAQESLKGGWQWIPLASLEAKRFPPANRCIINALQLPEHYLVSPPCGAIDSFVEQFSQCLRRGARLSVLRDYELDDEQYLDIMNRLVTESNNNGSQILIHDRTHLLTQVATGGIHLSAKQLMRCQQRPVANELWFAASCHNQAELDKALQLGADFAVLGPLTETASHPDASPLGWQAFSELVATIALPVYAIGGLSTAELSHSQDCGAQGVAGITSLWQEFGTC